MCTDIVLPMYRMGFLQAMSDADELYYADMQWGDDEVVQLAQALSYVYQQTGRLPGKLALWLNKIGHRGAKALVDLGATGALGAVDIDLRNNRIHSIKPADFRAKSVDLAFNL